MDNGHTARDKTNQPDILRSQWTVNGALWCRIFFAGDLKQQITLTSMWACELEINCNNSRSVLSCIFYSEKNKPLFFLV